ncbi:MAG: exonuclease domain-containing protein [Oligosphaeraceae bacterium]
MALTTDIPLALTEAAVLDFETTGEAAENPNAPWQIGVVLLARGKVDLSRSFQSLLRVPRDYAFNPYTPGRWARLREELACAPTLQELWPTLRPLLQGRPLVAHNVPTERGILSREFPLQSFGPWLDTLTLARAAFPRQQDFKLENLAPALGLLPVLQTQCPGLNAHDAFYDAVACATLLETLLAAPGWRELSAAQLAAIRPRRSR